MPDGRHFLFIAFNLGVPTGVVYGGSLDSPDRTRLLDGVTDLSYAPGFLLFVRGTTLLAQPFDPDRLATTGEAVPMVDPIRASPSSGTAVFGVSNTGVLVYQATSLSASRLTWFDRAGKSLGVIGERGNYNHVFLSPDRTRVSVSMIEPAGRRAKKWILDVARGFRTRFTFDPGDELEGPWSPDGSRIVFNSSRQGHLDLYQKAASGAGNEELLWADEVEKSPQSWSSDGRYILYIAQQNAQDLWVLPLFGDKKPFPLLHTPFTETMGQFSPDGRFVAYVSTESGRAEVYVAPFPGPGGKWPVSTAGGFFPRWRRDGREIFYQAGDGTMMVAAVTTRESTVEVGDVRPLFKTRTMGSWPYDVSADGQRFLMNTPDEAASVQPFTLVVNWPAALKK